MNILPKFTYLFQCLPINVPKSFFKELNKLITSFIWQKKNPRVKLSSLQAPYSRGGLNLPNFRNYYLASQYRSILIWLYAERSEVRWVPIEQYEVNPISLKDVPFLGTKKCLSKLTNNSIILNTFRAWQESHSLLKINISFLRRTPLWGNPDLSHHISDSILRGWKDRNIRTVADLYNNDTFIDFQQLKEKFKLPDQNFFKFLQIRDWIKEKTKGTFPEIPKESPFETHLCTKPWKSIKGIVSSIYTIINEKLPDYNKTSLKRKWEADLGYVYEEVEWYHLMEQAQTMLISTNHRQMQFNIFHRTYYTPYRLHKIDINYSPKCLRCKVIDGDLLHMLWNCPVIEEFWRRTTEIISRVIGIQVEMDPKLWILGDIDSINVDYHKKYFILLANTRVCS
uniref:Reverse transcriptase zinc-binding domain-containing protein n=1 Tax=Astatotilapia calliptera TaxID=8154 RepID=A0AAX7UZI2_ASTCA